MHWPEKPTNVEHYHDGTQSASSPEVEAVDLKPTQGWFESILADNARMAQLVDASVSKAEKCWFDPSYVHIGESQKVGLLRGRIALTMMGMGLPKSPLPSIHQCIGN